MDDARYLPKNLRQRIKSPSFTTSANVQRTLDLNIYHRSNDGSVRGRVGGGNQERRDSGESLSKKTPVDVAIVIADDETGEETTELLCVPRDIPLKQCLQTYAEKLGGGCSLSKIQFATRDESTGTCRSIFVSEMGKKNFNELGWTDQRDGFGRIVIVAKRIPDPTLVAASTKGAKDGVAARCQASRSKKTRKKKKKCNSSSQQKRGGKNEESEGKMLVRFRIEHSHLLTELFDEAAKTFKEIRTSLNNDNLQQRSPKVRGAARKAAAPFCDESGYFGAVGGKAGVTRYVVRVGEIAHLYKTSKPSVARRARSSNPSSSSSSRLRSSIDLHGLTRDDAVATLDACLPRWLDDANSGVSPWVTTVEIVTGSGNQILSEAVRQWIHGNDQVARAPATALA